MTFLDKLDYLKEREGLNNRTLSQKADIPYTTIDSFYKKGYRNMKFETLEKLSRFFNVSLDFLMNDAIEEEKYGINSDDGENLFKYLQYESGERTMRLNGVEADIIESFRLADDTSREMVLRALRLDQDTENLKNEIKILFNERKRLLAAHERKDTVSSQDDIDHDLGMMKKF